MSYDSGRDADISVLDLIVLGHAHIDEFPGHRFAPLADTPLKGTELSGLEISGVLLLEPLEEFLGGDVGLFLEPPQDMRPHLLERVYPGSVGAR